MESDLFISQDQTLREAKAWLRERLDRGAKCPCCTQFAKVYKRALASSLTAALCALYRLGRDYHHVNEILAEAHLKASVGREFSIVRYWGLTEEKKDKEGDETRTTGYWKITDNGVAFVEHRAVLMSHVKLYDSRCLGFAGKEVNVVDCLGKKFNYGELMQ